MEGAYSSKAEAGRHVGGLLAAVEEECLFNTKMVRAC